MANVYFCADLHFGHKAICKYRTQFSSAEEHNDTILDNILTTTNKRDTLWVLGDICFTKDALEYLQRISNHVAHLRVVLGNHCLQGKGVSIQNYVDICDSVEAFRSWKNCWLSHCPIHPNEMRGRILNIHGHTHYYIMPEDYYYCVSMEQINYRPVDWNQIKEERPHLFM